MNSIEAVIFFGLIVTANCLISDDIYNVLEKQCNQPTSLLKPLNLDLCSTAGNRGVADLLCHGITAALVDICDKSSKITLQQVLNSTKFNDTPQDFCNRTSSAKIDPTGLPNNVSENLKLITKNSDCLWFCSTVGRFNPMCPFLLSFVQLKNPAISKKTISNAVPVMNPGPTNVSNTDKQQEPAKKIDVPKPDLEKDDRKEADTADSEAKGPDVQSVPKPELENNLPAEKESVPAPNPDQEGKDSPHEQNDASSKVDDVQLQTNNDADVDNNNPSKNEDDDLNTLNKESDLEQPKEPSDTVIKSEPAQQDAEAFVEAESGHFFAYFVFISALCMFFYVAMYNKKKILALLIEGRRTNVKRRPNSAAYSKLDCTLEEAMASGPSTSSSNTLLY